MASPSSTSTSNPRAVAGYLYLSAAITIIVGVVLGVVISPIWFAVVAVGFLDIILARLFATGALGGGADKSDPAAAAEADPSYNPYARED
jgi:ABC-type cobalt transport system substrate-binding protein